MIRGSKPSEERSRLHGIAAQQPLDAMGANYAGLSNGEPMPPAYCRMFFDARRILGLSETDLAQRLNTDPATIRALETGHLSALPPWPETSRVVTAYLAGLGLDARPALHSLARDLAALPPRPSGTSKAGTNALRAKPATGGDWRGQPRHLPPASAGGSQAKAGPPAWVIRLGRTPGAINGAVGTAARSAVALGRRSARRVSSVAGMRRRRGEEQSGRRAGGLRLGIAASVLAVLIAAVSQTSLAASVMSAAAVPMPAMLTRAFGHVADMVRVQLAPVRDGLRWIEVEDPRTRRGDKLQTARR